MKKTSLKKRSFVILLILFCYILSYNGIKTDFISALTPHASISITDDSGFSVFPGTGTSEDPYVIDGYNITTTEDNNGIYITSTTKYFVISNCYIDALDYGIRIHNIADGTATITNNTCENNDIGIALFTSSNNTLSANNCTSNNDYGIALFTSSYNNVTENNCNNNNYGIYLSSSSNFNTLSASNCTDNNYGIYLFSSCNNNTLSTNYCSNNIYGIYLRSSNYNTVISNNCSNNTNYGIYLYSSSNFNTLNENNCTYNNCGIYLYTSSSYNLLKSNICMNNSHAGIYLSHSNNNNLTMNNCINNTDYGICLYSSHNTVSLNNCTQNPGGIYVPLFSNYNIIISNNCINNTNYGIYLYSSSNNTVISNNCSNNTHYGIYLYTFSENNTISSNNCTHNSCGICLSYFSNYNNVTENNCINNTNYGIHVIRSLDNTVSFNNCMNNTNYGIYLETSSESNIISSNNCTQNSHGIFYLDSSYNTVSSNNCSNNNENGISIYTSSYCLVNNNFLQDNVGYGINIPAFSYYNHIYHNTFVDNNLGGTSQGYDAGTGNHWDNQSISEGNFWSDWTGGDYFIDGSANAVDHYPFEYPPAAPVIEDVTYSPSTPTNFDVITISATIIDPSGIDSVTLHYRINAGGWLVSSMTLSTGSTYQTTIGTFTVYTVISYYITAVDNSSHHHEAIEDNSGLYYQFTVAQGDIIPPSITDVSQEPSTPNDLETITISATVGDSSGIDSVTLHYRINGGSWSTITMVLSTGSTYQVTIGPFTTSSIIEYYITAIDSAPNHNEATDDNNGLYYQFSISSSDFTEPTITDVSHEPSTPNDLDTITISATVGDSSGIDSVTLHYRINGGSWSTVSMTLSTGSIYQATIGPFTMGSTIEYYITAIDSAPNHNEATEDNNGLFYQFSIASSDFTKPTITDVSHDPSAPTNLETITISATVSDSSGIDSVTLHYRVNGGSWSTLSMTLSTGSTYQATIGPFNDADNIEYYITAVDNSTNNNQATNDNGGLFYSFTVLNIVPEYAQSTMVTAIFAISLLFISYSIRRKN